MTREEWTEKHKAFGHAEGRNLGIPAWKRKKMKRPAGDLALGRRADECPKCSRTMTAGATQCSHCTNTAINRLNDEAVRTDHGQRSSRDRQA